MPNLEHIQSSEMRPPLLLIHICRKPLLKLPFRRVKAVLQPLGMFNLAQSCETELEASRYATQTLVWSDDHVDNALALVLKPPCALDECSRFAFFCHSRARLRARFRCSVWLFSSLRVNTHHRSPPSSSRFTTSACGCRRG